MTTAGNREQLYFDLAFELAYCLHANKEVAFFIAEDALDTLGLTLGHQEKNRTPSDRLRGFLKWGERTRPIRKTVRLSEKQMLQWLVYKQSEVWELETERGEGLYLPNEEDLIVRYIEQLVFITLRRGSFYVTLAVCSLLHQFNRRETRLFYDILTQSDSARMKDTSYIGKQRLEMLERVSRRFGDMIQTANRPGEEKQFVMRPLNQEVVELVHECLRRFAPWETTCVVEPGFDVTDIPGLYFSESGDALAEELIEMCRIRAVLDPECFAVFAKGLSKYVRRLPNGDQDSGCDYGSPDTRLSIPQFSNFPGGTPRGDRFQPPKLTKEDYVRLERTLDARGHRRKNFSPRQLRIYVDAALVHSFDLKATNRARLQVGAEASTVEVRGLNNAVELPLATLLLNNDHLRGGNFVDSVEHEGGQRLTFRLSPVLNAGDEIKGAQLEVSYTEAGLTRIVSRLARRVSYLSGGTLGVRGRSPSGLKSQNGWLPKVVVAALIIVVSALLWWRFLSPSSVRVVTPAEQASQPQGNQTNVGEREGQSQPVTLATPPPPIKQLPTPKEVKAPIARAAWSTNREAALLAVTVEPTRGEIRTINLSRRETQVFLGLPLYDDEGRVYSRYRLTLSASEMRLWQQTLSAPQADNKRYNHVLSFSLLSRQLPKAGSYDLQVEGFSQGAWNRLGRVVFSPKEH